MERLCYSANKGSDDAYNVSTSFTDVKDEDERANTVAVMDACVMDERGNEEDIADEQSNVPPGPAVEEEEARDNHNKDSTSRAHQTGNR